MSNNTVFAAGRRYIFNGTQKPYKIADVGNGGGLAVQKDANDAQIVVYRRDGWGDETETLARTVDSFAENFTLVAEKSALPVAVSGVPIAWVRDRIGWVEETGRNDGAQIQSIMGGRSEAYCAHTVASAFAETVGALPNDRRPKPKTGGENPLASTGYLAQTLLAAGWAMLKEDAAQKMPVSDDKQTVVIGMGQHASANSVAGVIEKSTHSHVGLVESWETVGGVTYVNTVEGNTKDPATGKQGVFRRRWRVSSSWIIYIAVVPHDAVAPKKKKPTAKQVPAPQTSLIA